MARSLNFRQLEAFRAVMLTGGMTPAGKLLFISQPAVTRLIRDLEADLGLALFVRRHTQLIATEGAHRLYREVERYFSGGDRIREVARTLRETRDGQLHIGAMPNLVATCLPGVVSRFLLDYPNVVVSIHSDSSTNLMAMLLHGQLDLALAIPPDTLPDLEHDVFAPMEAVCIIPPAHALAQHRVINVADLHQQDFVSLGVHSTLRMRLNALMHELNVQPRVRLETAHSSTVAAYVREGVGVAVVDSFAAMGPGSEGLVVRPLKPDIAVRFCALYRHSKQALPMARAFAVTLRDALDEGKHHLSQAMSS